MTSEQWGTAIILSITWSVPTGLWLYQVGRAAAYRDALNDLGVFTDSLIGLARELHGHSVSWTTMSGGTNGGGDFGAYKAATDADERARSGSM